MNTRKDELKVLIKDTRKQIHDATAKVYYTIAPADESFIEELKEYTKQLESYIEEYKSLN